MLVLALDTTLGGGSCALARGGVVIGELAGGAGRTQAARLPGDLMALLAREGVSLPEIDLFAVSTGPGSFTGLRVGIATMQGLAFAEEKPLVGISTFDALAAVGGAARVATWVDAWRGEVFAALYENGREVEPPTVAAPGPILARLAGRPTTFVGDGAAIYRHEIRAALDGEAEMAEPAVPLLAGTIARLATAAARGGARPQPHAIRPLYVRRSDAERARDARSSD